MQIASFVLAGVAAIFFIKPDTLIDKNTKNSTLRMLHDNARLIGVGLLIIAFYLYSFNSKQKNKNYTQLKSPDIDLEMSNSDLSSSIPSELPTYDQSELTKSV